MDLRIEIEPGSNPIRGILHSGDPALSQPFVGWMGLVELIAAAAANIGEPAPETDHPD